MTHINLIHEMSNVKFPCGQCDYKATKRGNLSTHINSRHLGVKFPCDQCDTRQQQGHL